MNAIEKAQRELDIACLETLAANPRPVKVWVSVDSDTHVDVVFTQEQLQASCERQLRELRR